MSSILKKLYTGSKAEAARDIWETYHRQGYAIIAFLYFSNVMRQRLVEEQSSETQRAYLQALEHADYILPDGIALQLFYQWTQGKEHFLSNLNGTDFTPYFLEQVDRERVELFLYGGTKEVAEKTAQYFMLQGWKVVHWQDGYTSFDWSKLSNHVFHDQIDRVLLVARGTPRQEIRGDEYAEQIYHFGLLVLHVGGLFDFLSGSEQRAPSWMVKARVLETPWRVLTNPKKNFKKLRWMFGIFRYRIKSIWSGK